MRRSRNSSDAHREPSAFREVVVTVALALLLAWLVQAFLVKPYRIPSESMENTLRCQDRILANRIGYRFADPQRGDVVVFHPPAAVDERGTVDAGNPAETDIKTAARTPLRRLEPSDLNYIKRIIGEPGDRVEVRDHRVYLDGKRLREPYLHPLVQGESLNDLANIEEFTVPNDRYLMLGDNRNHSYDSRRFGFVPKTFIVGEAFLVYWPPSRFGGLPTRDPGGPASMLADPNCDQGLMQQ